MKRVYRRFIQSLLIAMLIVLGSFTIDSTGQTVNDIDTSFYCNNTGTVFYGGDDCGYFILQDDGKILHPYQKSVPKFFEDSIRIIFGYEAYSDNTDECNLGKRIYLTCVELISSEECRADFFYYPLDMLMIDSVADQPDFVGFPYMFIDSSYGDVMIWEWVIEGKVFENDQKLLYIFPAPGSYEVSHTIITADKCVSTVYKTIIVGDTIQECEANFNYFNPIDNDSVYYDYPESKVIQFNDQSAGNPVKWEWEFGDGTSSIEQNPMHEFPYLGSFEVCLIITTKTGCEDIHCETVYIDSINQDCNALFEHCTYHIPSSSDSMLLNQYIVGFKNLSTPNSAYPVWEFGDGTTSYEQNPVHIFQNPGIYNVCLSINSLWGCYAIYCEMVSVGVDPCSIDFRHELLVPDCGGYEIAHLFVPVPGNKADWYYWDFGDGTGSYDKEAIHTFAAEGSYKVCLQAQFKDGCMAYQCKEIYNSNKRNDSLFYEKCSALGLNSPEEEKGFQVTNVYPSPASDVISIELNSELNDEITFTILNMMGQVVTVSEEYTISSGHNILEMNVGALETGNYFYRLISESGIAQGRISIAE